MSKEIRQKVNECYKKMDDIINPCAFGLQPEMMEITKEIRNLQEKCNHHFVDGRCEFCDKEENK